MPRNRLDELQRIGGNHSTSNYADQPEEMVPLNGGHSHTNDSDAFLERLSEAVTRINLAEKNTCEVRNIQRMIFNSTHRDDTKESRIKELMAGQKLLAVKIRAFLTSEQQWIEDNNKPDIKRNMTKGELKLFTMRKTQIESNSKRFCDIWATYNQDQVDYRDKTKRLFIKRCKITNADFSDEQIEKMLDDGNTQIFATSILDQSTLARQQLTELQDRHDQFIKLEASIREVRDIFMEIQHLVAQQGEMVDNIANVVQKSVMDVEAGQKHLQEAERNKQKARKKKIILGVILSIVLLIVILVILGTSEVSENPLSYFAISLIVLNFLLFYHETEPFNIRKLCSRWIWSFQRGKRTKQVSHTQYSDPSANNEYNCHNSICYNKYNDTSLIHTVLGLPYTRSARLEFDDVYTY